MTVTPFNERGEPDLQVLVRSAGERLAGWLGEPYDPKHHPGFTEISGEEWAAYDQAVAAWQRRRRDLILGVL